MTHCFRELVHAQWKELLDDDFIEAWIHGIVVTCCDGVQRRFYPRIFTYSADYPEKLCPPFSAGLNIDVILFTRILLASIRNLGQCPCPRCLVTMSSVHKLGMRSDMRQRTSNTRKDNACRQSKVISARRLIHEKNYSVNSAAIEGLLKDESLVPTSVGVD